jgi:hypothetical protein
MARRKHPALYHSAALACLACCAFALGQEQFPPDYPPPPQSAQQQSPKPSVAQPSSQPAAAPAAVAPTVPSSLLDHPANPAKVSLASGKLSVEANNSNLSEILQQISDASGMKVDGLQGSGRANPRVFGSYGPGAPRDVLSELLDGAGYNVLMLGVTSSGAPRELSLSVRPTGAAPAQPQGNVANNNDSDDEIQPTQYPDEPQNFSPDQGPPEARNGVRTPQQMLRQLQRMQQQQEQQQQQQQNDQQN